MSADSISTAATATSRNTPILQRGNSGLDKNAFLKILTAELSNQDPQNAADSTQFVAQMAQFSSLEQMQNLNTTMTFSNATSLIGKTVNLSATDSNQQPYTGTVTGIFKNSNGVYIHLLMTQKDGTTSIEDFPYDSVAEVNY